MEQKLPLVGEPSVAEAQHRRAHAVRRACQRHHVHLHIRVYNHLLPGAHLGDGVDLVPQQRRRLEFQPSEASSIRSFRILRMSFLP